MMRISWVYVVSFIAGVLFQASGQTASDVFVGGNEHFRAGRFAEAVRAYESILGQGVASSPLYFNLGNAQYRLGNISEAILAYERALRLDPGDPDTRFNLQLANLRTIDRIDAVPELFLVSWARGLSSLLPQRTTAGILLVGWASFFGVLSALNIAPRSLSERTLRLTALSSLIVVVAAGALLGLQVYQHSDRSEAIVMADVVTAKASPDEQSVDAFVLHEGLKVRFSDSVGEWVRITLPDGKVGWVLSSTCERI